ncbi:MAG: Holliday junction resolvase RuvX [Bdellovibrionales bacterium]|nr:Holliday junction resolvase RuvX [Bdellovibrionales bacterium]
MTVHISLDVGKVRVGVALCDASGSVARPHGTFLRAQGAAEKQILELIENEQVEKILLGLPLDSHGNQTEQCDDIARFARRLSRRTALPLIFVDEYLSSERAKHRLELKGSPPQEVRKKGVIDAQAASIILQEYLDGILQEVAPPRVNRDSA